MKFRSGQRQRGVLAKLLHWLTAILVVFALAIILDPRTLDLTADPEHRRLIRRVAIYRHEAFGILVLATLCLRMAWRAFDKRPDLPTTMPRWEVRVSSLAHGALYLLAVASCILGWYRVSSNGAAVNFFGWEGLPALMGKDEHLHAIFRSWHEWVSWMFVGLVIFHLIAALKHHWIDHDRVLRNMLPFNR